MRDIKELSDSFPGCSRVYMKENTFERLPKLADALYPLVENRRIKLTYINHLDYDKTLMVDDSDLDHFASICKYRIEDGGGGEYVLANKDNLSDYLFAIYDAYPKEYAKLESGERFEAVGYINNMMRLQKEVVICSISHPEMNNSLVKALNHLDVSSSAFYVSGITRDGLLDIQYYSPRIIDLVNILEVKDLTRAFDVMFMRSF